MPAKSKEQQTAMRMALAARRGDIEVSKLKGAALEIYKSDMTNKEIEDFTVLKENYININESKMKAKNVEQFFGTLQQSTVEAWKKHLKTDKYSKHVALNDFYEDIVDVVDQLIEDYMSIYGKVENYENLLDEKEIGAIEYLETLRDFTRESADELLDEDDTELFSDVDNILSVIDTAIYKLKELDESKLVSLKDFILESIISEAKDKRNIEIKLSNKQNALIHLDKYYYSAHGTTGHWPSGDKNGWILSGESITRKRKSWGIGRTTIEGYFKLDEKEYPFTINLTQHEWHHSEGTDKSGSVEIDKSLDKKFWKEIFKKIAKTFKDEFLLEYGDILIDKSNGKEYEITHREKTQGYTLHF